MDILQCVTLAAILSIVTALIQVNDEKRLTQSLVEQYQKIGKLGRPVAKASDVWDVTIGLSLKRITELDIEDQTIEVIVWQYMAWKDVYLMWNKTEFHVDSIGMRPSDVTMPDITAYNAVSPAVNLATQPLIEVMSDGSMVYIPPIKQKFSCPVHEDDVSVTCSMKYGSWMHNGEKLNLERDDQSMDLSTYEANPNWEVIGSTVTRNVTLYECCPKPYIDVTFNLMLKKQDSSRLSRRQMLAQKLIWK